MIYTYDIEGWYTGAAAEGRGTSTPVPTYTAGQLPNWSGMSWIVRPAPIKIVITRQELLNKIDQDTDYVYRTVQGDRAAEYALAEQEAIAHRDAGYTGTVPASVASWAIAKSQTSTWACDDILATATQWRVAQAAIRANRLLRKEQARTSTDLESVKVSWDAFVSNIKQVLQIV